MDQVARRGRVDACAKTVPSSNHNAEIHNRAARVNGQEHDLVLVRRLLGRESRPFVAIEQRVAASDRQRTPGVGEGEGSSTTQKDARNVGCVVRWGSRAVVVRVGDEDRYQDEGGDRNGDAAALERRGLPRLHSLRTQKDPGGQSKRADQDEPEAEECEARRSRNRIRGQGKAEAVLQQHKWARKGEAARRGCAIALGDQ